MPTNNSNNGSGTEESSDQEQQDEQQESTDETSGQEEQQSGNEEPVTLPDDHPLVKSLSALKGQVATQKAELLELRNTSKKVAQLEKDLNERPSQEAVETLQTRYDRLEEFAQAVGLGKALDSRTFTKDLFETDKDVADIVKEWNRQHPSATSTALGGGSTAPAAGKPSGNELIRAAMKGAK